MTLFQLALKNSIRRPLRTAVSIAGVAITISALFSVLTFERGYERGMASELDHLGAHVLVVPKGCPYDAASIALHGAKWPCYLKEDYLTEIRAVHEVGTAAPAFMSAVYEGSENAVYVGVEENILQLKRGWTIQGHFPRAEGELLAGSVTAQKHSWALNQEVDLPGLTGKRGRVSGILQPTHGPDDTFVYMRLPDAQKLFQRPGELTHVLVRLRDPNELDRCVAQLHGCGVGMDMNVVPLAHLFRTIQSLINSTRVLFGAIVLVALLVAAAGVSNTVLMAVIERTSEIGMLRALGATKLHIFRLFWLETVEICLAGGIAGVLGAAVLARVVEAWLRSQLPFAPTHALLTWEWSPALFCLGAGLLLGTVAALLPAWRAAQLQPMEAMRASG